MVTPLLVACPSTTKDPKPPPAQAPKVVSIIATPDGVTAADEQFTITWTTSNTTAAHVCRLGVRPAQGGDDAIKTIGDVACGGSMKHAPTGEGDFNYVLTIHHASGDGLIAQATSNTVSRNIPDLGNTLWTRQFGTNDDDDARGVATDATGNIIIAGNTDGSLDGNNAGSYDVFVRKYDPNGNILWTRQFGTNAYDKAQGVATDAAGNIIIAGLTRGSLWGINAGSYDAFVRKYDPNGNTLWTRQFGTATFDRASGIATDAAGNIIITGDTDGSLEGAKAGGYDGFVRKYDPDGNILWTRQFGTETLDAPIGVATDAARNIIITGETTGSLEGTNAGESDAFVRKYDPNGNILWTRQFGTATHDRGSGIATDAAGNVIIAGTTDGSLDGNNAGSFDAFVRKYDPNGVVLWTRQFGSDAYDYAPGVATDAAGNIIIIGETTGSLEGTNAGESDAFVRKYDPNGDILWTRQFGTNADDHAWGVATDAPSNIIITGETTGSLEGNNAGNYDAFIRKYTP